MSALNQCNISANPGLWPPVRFRLPANGIRSRTGRTDAGLLTVSRMELRPDAKVHDRLRLNSGDQRVENGRWVQQNLSAALDVQSRVSVQGWGGTDRSSGMFCAEACSRAWNADWAHRARREDERIVAAGIGTKRAHRQWIGRNIRDLYVKFRRKGQGPTQSRLLASCAGEALMPKDGGPNLRTREASRVAFGPAPKRPDWSESCPG